MTRDSDRLTSYRRRLFGHGFITNELGHPLMVTRPNGELELPGGESIGDEPAVRPVGYHLRHLGLTNRPGRILLVDHLEATRLGANEDSFNFVFHCGELTPTEVESIKHQTLPADVMKVEFVDPRWWRPNMTAHQRRCLDVAVAVVANNNGCPYLRNGLRVNHLSDLPSPAPSRRPC